MDPDKSQNNNTTATTPAADQSSVSSVQQPTTPNINDPIGQTDPLASQTDRTVAQTTQQPQGLSSLLGTQDLTPSPDPAMPQQSGVQAQQGDLSSQTMQTTPLTSTPRPLQTPQTPSINTPEPTHPPAVSGGGFAQSNISESLQRSPVASPPDSSTVSPQKPSLVNEEPPTTVNSTAASLGNVDSGLSAPREGEDPLARIETADLNEELSTPNLSGPQSPSDSDTSAIRDDVVVGLQKDDLKPSGSMDPSDDEAGSSGKNY